MQITVIRCRYSELIIPWNMNDTEQALSNRQTFYIIAILIATIAIIATIRVLIERDLPVSQNEPVLTDERLIEGKRLSRLHCSSCHVYPEPGLLTKNTWTSETLPAMGPLLGIYSHNGIQYRYAANPSQTQYLPSDYYPAEPELNSEEWQKILDYYEHAAPEFLIPAAREPEIVVDSLFFRSHIPHYEAGAVPVVTMVKFDPGNRLIYVSDSNSNGLNVFDENLEQTNLIDFSSPVTSIQFLENSAKPGLRNMLLTFIGHLDPSDAPLGSVSKGWYDPSTGEADIRSIVYKDSLTRPVDSQFADLTGNGLDDLLIAEFGNRVGRFSWLENTGDGFDPKRNILVDTPGCIQSYILDITNNGLNDIVTLCTQIDQSIYLFKNHGNGIFEKQTLKKFDITAGSSSFELHDFNGNGHLDILYTSGDNADYSKIYKPYHGVYIFINDGNFNFTEEWFYPINGAYRAIARDFNKNGHLDLAVIAYFADFVRRPQEGFIFFKNEGGFSFIPYHHPASRIGRWLTMDVADWTGNGYEDIVLGNFPLGPDIGADPFRMSWSERPQFLLLENRMGELE